MVYQIFAEHWLVARCYMGTHGTFTFSFIIDVRLFCEVASHFHLPNMMTTMTVMMMKLVT